MTDFTLRNCQREKSQWQNILCSGIQDWNPKPQKIDFLVDGDIFIILFSGEHRLIAELLHVDENKRRSQQVGSCVVGYVGKNLSIMERMWLQNLYENFSIFSFDQKKDWDTYLLWASRQLKRSFSNPTEKYLT